MKTRERVLLCFPGAISWRFLSGVEYFQDFAWILLETQRFTPSRVSVRGYKIAPVCLCSCMLVSALTSLHHWILGKNSDKEGKSRRARHTQVFSLVIRILLLWCINFKGIRWFDKSAVGSVTVGLHVQGRSRNRIPGPRDKQSGVGKSHQIMATKAGLRCPGHILLCVL